MEQQSCATLPLDALARAILFLNCTDAVRTRLVSHRTNDAFDRACQHGPALATTLPSTGDWPLPSTGVSSKNEKFAERVCRALQHRPCDDGAVPLWLRFVRRDVLMAVLARGGCAAACDGLASGPFWFAQEDARSHGNLALRWAAANGHVAVLDRLAAQPFLLQREDARSCNNAALCRAAANGHVAVIDRLALPPFSLDGDDATGANDPFRDSALTNAAAGGHVAVVDRLALPPFSIGQEHARSRGHAALCVAGRNGHVAILDRLALPPFLLDQEDAQSNNCLALWEAARNGQVAVLDRLALPPYSLGQPDAPRSPAVSFTLPGAAIIRLSQPPYSRALA